MKGLYRSPPVDDRLIWDAWLSSHNLPAMLAADEISLFDALDAQPLTVQQAAKACNVNSRALGIITLLLCALGFLNKREGRLGLTVTSRNYLVKSSNFYWGALLGFWKENQHVYDQLIEALKPGAAHKGGAHAEGWAAGKIGLEEARGIAAFMHAHSCAPAMGVARTDAFKDVKRLLDVGAGSGVFAIAAAQAWPELRATVMDLDTMCAAASKYIEDGEVADRVDTVAVDMFREAWPAGYDALFFSNIFHDWNDERCLELARRAYASLAPGGVVLVQEALLDEDRPGPLWTAHFSLMMALDMEARQFRPSELAGLLTDAGFVDVRVAPLLGCTSTVIGTRPLTD